MRFCPKCNSETNMMVSITVVMPSKYESLLTKKVMASKDFKVWGASWDLATYICPLCQYTYSNRKD